MESPGDVGGAPTAASLLARFAAVRSARLTLSRPSSDDAPAVFRIPGDPETNRYNPNGPLPDLGAAEIMLRGWLRQWAEDGFGYWAVRREPAGEIIGFGGVRRMPMEHMEARDILNLYYRFTPTAWGHGYATKMAREAVRLARSALSALPIVARVRPANLLSIKTAERAGLTIRPDLGGRDHLIYALGWPEEAH